MHAQEDGKNEIFFSSGAKKSWCGVHTDDPSSSFPLNSGIQSLGNPVNGSIQTPIDENNDEMDIQNESGADLIGSRSTGDQQELVHPITIHPSDNAPKNAFCRLSNLITQRLFACSTDYIGNNSSDEADVPNMGGFLKRAIEESERRRPIPPPIPGYSSNRIIHISIGLNNLRHYSSPLRAIT
jgi:hypothetical protein